MLAVRRKRLLPHDDFRTTAIITIITVIAIICSCGVSVVGTPVQLDILRQETLPTPSFLPSVSFTPSSSVSPTSSLSDSDDGATTVAEDVDVPESSSAIEEATPEEIPPSSVASSPQPALPTPSSSSLITATPTPSPSPLSPSSDTESGSETAAQPAASEESASSLVLPLAALIAISVGVAVAFILALALIIFMVQRRGAARDGTSKDDDQGNVDDHRNDGRSESASSSPDAPSAGNVATVSASSTAAGSNDRSGMGSKPNRGERALPPLNSTTNAVVPSVNALPSTSGRSDMSSFPPSYVGPSAPSPSQFTRRDSDASSDSSDTIVAPIYANDSVSTSAAAPWFIGNDSRFGT